MNYLKQLIYQFTLNESQSSGCQEACPDESGEFQVIELDQDPQVQHQQNKKTNHTKVYDSAKLINGPTTNNGSEQNQEQRQNDWKTRHSLRQEKGKYTESQREERQCAQKVSKEYTLVELDPHTHSNGSASTIQLDEYYMIVSTEELTKKFSSPQQWTSFYQKVNQFNTQHALSTASMINSSVSCSMAASSSPQRKTSKLSLNLKQLNSLLQLKPDEIQRRIEYWDSVAVAPVNIRLKHTELSNKKDPKRLMQNVSKICSHLVPSLLAQIEKNKLSPIGPTEDQVEKWKACLIKVLTLYGANDKQIGYSKGLQYIALGILVAKPFIQSQNTHFTSFNHDQSSLYSLNSLNSPNSLNSVNSPNQQPQYQQPHFNPLQQSSTFPQSQQTSSSSPQSYTSLQTHFKYLLFTKQLRNMYFPGTPKLYQQIYLLTELMRSQVPELYLKLEQLKVDFIKLFINYYKTFLLYKVKNPQVIRKVMELLVVYGIDIVRIVLTRIMNRNQKIIQEKIQGQEIELLKYLAQSLVEDYFGEHSTSEDVILKFKHLFVLDTIS